ncbi:hypothetical protein GYMLUDRAFT_579427 [Collybiopsis luxurians FD-317 M1]|uniref:Rhodopsin domain-containing protein n=1 Tax=Collybiopsis luxurians FD-317 M1 TaxID=944289 RepID=A0A0D0CY91_9AGAR|nr:hypothetical protein GYMLUDRAFT_579427 [Collybiopsis luxurians FD-317 M1]
MDLDWMSSRFRCARFSLILSTVRLIPTLFTLRRISEFAFISFLLMCMGILTAKLYFCASDVSWYKSPTPACPFNNNTELAVADLILYLVADVILIIIPLRLMYRITLPWEKRRMLLLMFGASTITSIIAVLRVTFIIDTSWSFLFLIVRAEVGTALIVANLAILTPYIYRLATSEGDFDSEPDTYYRSFQPDGGIVMRRVSDLAPRIPHDNTTRGSSDATATDGVSTTVHLPNAEPEADRSKECVQDPWL